ncbi:putative mediator complex subunit 26 [Tieghemostelium lacteum]|uniref:Putative mediator complex subunit 26 n=1 Tax=Tieghemostelium lacteum TaxID=361077 RepID=A0A151Z514_TIELA|nr:putative mediator complex subunit 26 [Tieghemostelium lacteum]|eukprot:KYQ89052.1 putative mediator complex subunit 26 [Tieghemostelium lacteum]
MNNKNKNTKKRSSIAGNRDKNKTENLNYLSKSDKIKKEQNDDYVIDNKRKNARMSLGRVSFANTIEVRIFEKTNENNKSRRASTPFGKSFEEDDDGGGGKENQQNQSNQQLTNTNSKKVQSPKKQSPTSTTTTTTSTTNKTDNIPTIKEEDKHGNFFERDDEESTVMDKDQQTMDLTATYGRIFVPYVKDEIQMLRVDDSDLSIMSSNSNTFEESQQEDQDDTKEDVVFKVPSIKSILDDDEVTKYEYPNDSELQDNSDEYQDMDISKVYTSSIHSPNNHKKLRLSTNNSSNPSINSSNLSLLTPIQRNLSSLLAEEEDEDELVNKNLNSTFQTFSINSTSPIIETSTDTIISPKPPSQSPSSPNIPTLNDLITNQEEDLTNGDVKEMIEQFQESQSNSSSKCTTPNMDKSVMFHQRNGTLGSGGKLSNLIKDDENDEYNPDAEDMAMTKSLGRIISMINKSSPVNTSVSDLQDRDIKDMSMTQSLGKVLSMYNNTANALKELKDRDVTDMSITQSLGKILQQEHRPQRKSIGLWTKGSSENTNNLNELLQDYATTNIGNLLQKNAASNSDQDDSEMQDIQDMTLTKTNIGAIIARSRLSLAQNKNQFHADGNITHNLKGLLQESTNLSKSPYNNKQVQSTTNSDESDLNISKDSNLTSGSQFEQNLLTSFMTQPTSNQNGIPKESESMITLQNTSVTKKNQLKQYTCTPSFTANENDDSFLYGKINFDRSILNSQGAKSNVLSKQQPQQQNDKKKMDSIEEAYGKMGQLTETFNMKPIQSLVLEDLNHTNNAIQNKLNLDQSGVPQLISFNDFIYLANCRFMDDYSFKSKRSSLIGMNMATDIEENSETDFKSVLIAVYSHNRHKNVLKAGYEELKRMINQINEDNKVQEEHITKNNPPIFQHIQLSTKDDLLSKQHLLKKIKNTSKLSTQLTYIQWRNELEKAIQQEILRSKSELEKDQQVMLERIQQMKTEELGMIAVIQNMKNREKQLIQEKTAKMESIKQKKQQMDTSKQNQQKLVQLEQLKETCKLIQSFSSWVTIQLTNELMELQYLKYFKVYVQLDLNPTQSFFTPNSNSDNNITSIQFKLLPNTTKFESDVFEILAIEQQIKSAKSLKQLCTIIQDVSMEMFSFQRLLGEIQQLETFYNITKLPNTASNHQFTSSGFNTSSSSPSKYIPISVQLSNLLSMKKISLHFKIPSTYPRGKVEFAYDIILGDIDKKQIISIINQENSLPTNSFKSKLSKIIQSLETLL